MHEMRGSVFWETHQKGCKEGMMSAQVINIIGMIAAVLTALAAQADLFPDAVKGYITVGALIAGTVFAYLTKPGTATTRATEAAGLLPPQPVIQRPNPWIGPAVPVDPPKPTAPIDGPATKG
jgi:hypothetical protein